MVNILLSERHGVEEDFLPVGTESRDVFHWTPPVSTFHAITTSSATCLVGGTASEILFFNSSLKPSLLGNRVLFDFRILCL